MAEGPIRLTSARVASPIGPVTIVALGGRVCGIALSGEQKWLRGALKRRFGRFEIEDAPDSTGAVDGLSAYFAGDLAAIDRIAVDAGGTAFQAGVWAELRRIPAGRTVSYGELADRLGCREAVRAVGAANGQNPIPIVIPCHRVIGSDGRLVGYGGGLPTKRWLLTHEGALLA